MMIPYGQISNPKGDTKLKNVNSPPYQGGAVGVVELTVPTVLY